VQRDEVEMNTDGSEGFRKALCEEVVILVNAKYGEVEDDVGCRDESV
jgi:hypothetical protein